MNCIFFIQIKLESVTKYPIDNNSALVQVMGLGSNIRRRNEDYIELHSGSNS